MIFQRKALCRQGILKSSCVRKETIDIDILITSRNGSRRIMQTIGTTSVPTTRIRKWNQFSRFIWTSTKCLHNSTIRQGFKRGSKWRANSPKYPFIHLSIILYLTSPNCKLQLWAPAQTSQQYSMQDYLVDL